MISEAVSSLEEENVKLKGMVMTLQAMLSSSPHKPRHCESCKHFMQHYIKNGGRYLEAHQGHCMRDRKVGRNRSVEDSCKDFEFGKYE